MPELEAEVGPPEAVDGDGQFDDLTPPRAVVVIEDEGAVLRDVGLAGSQTDAVLRGGGVTVSALSLICLFVMATVTKQPITLSVSPSA